MRGDGAGILQIAAILQIIGNRGGAEGVATGSGGQPGMAGAAFYHLQDIAPVHAVFRNHAMAVDTAEEGGLRLACNTGSTQSRINVFLRLVVRGNHMFFAAFFMEAEPPPFAALVIILDLHRRHRADTPKSIDHHAEKRPVTQPGQ